MITSRRSFITGLASIIAAPAIVRAASLMPVKIIQPVDEQDIYALLAQRLRDIEQVTIRGMTDNLYGPGVHFDYQKWELSGDWGFKQIATRIQTTLISR